MMRSYGQAYKNYYSNIRNSVNPRGGNYKSASIEELLYSDRKIKSKKSKNKIFNIADLLIKQLIGAIVLFVLVFTLKMLPSEKAQSVYLFSESLVKSDFDYKEFIDYIKCFNLSEYLNKIDLGI